MYNFDEIIDRGPASGSYSSKWQGYEGRFPGYQIDTPNTISMWVADMDFRCMPEIVDAVVKRAQHGIFGYSSEDANHAFRRAAAGWFERRYGWKADTSWMLFAPGVVPAINAAVQEFTEPGDGVIIQPPVYYPFADGIRNNGRIIAANPLVFRNGRYEMDFAGLETLAKDPRNKLMVLSNPHNPVGRVWTADELRELCRICHENQVVLFSDEIHGDLIMKGHKLTAVGTFTEFADNLIAAHAASKTFNLAGLSASLITVPNPDLRKRMAARMLANRLPAGNTFGPIAGEAAYLYGDRYVDELVAYLEGNFDYAIDYAAKHLPGVRIVKPEGTYLVWFDFNGTGMTPEEINHLVLEQAKVTADLGTWFGEGGAGFLRFNFACPRATVHEALERIAKALAARK